MIAPAPGSVRSVAGLGMRGGVRLRAELVAGRTRITELSCHPPLQILRAHHVDPERPDLASVILASPSGGVLQGDELTIDVRVGRGARLRVLTQSATRVYRTPVSEARVAVNLEVDPGGYLEYLPDPIIPYAGSRYRSRATFVVAETGTLIAWEIVAPGRVARDEILAFDRFESSVEIVRPEGTLLATDAVVLDGREEIRMVGALGAYIAFGTLYLVRSRADPAVLRGAVEDEAALPISVGASSLPFGAGAWLRVLGDRQSAVSALLATAYRAAVSTQEAEPGAARLT